MAYRRSNVPNLKAVLAKVGKVAVEEARAALVDYATDERDLFVEKIEDQRFASFNVIFYPESGTNLSPRWLARKAAKGADSRTAIATGHYVSQIKVFRKVKQNGTLNVRVGFRADARAHDLDGNVQDVKLDLVAKVLENGSSKMHIPPRPHWGPHFNGMVKARPKTSLVFAKRIATKLKKALPAFVKKVV